MYKDIFLWNGVLKNEEMGSYTTLKVLIAKKYAFLEPMDGTKKNLDQLVQKSLRILCVCMCLCVLLSGLDESYVG